MEETVIGIIYQILLKIALKSMEKKLIQGLSVTFKEKTFKSYMEH